MTLKNLSQKSWENWWGFFFIAPWLIGFLLLYLIPMAASFGFSFMSYNLIQPEQSRFIGLTNWRRALTQDPQVLASVGRVLVFSMISLPITFGVSLSVAILLNSRMLLGTKLFRVLFYMPTMVPLVATVLIWNGVLNEHTGWINHIIQNLTGYQAVGSDGIRWLANPSLIYFAYTFIGLWGIGNSMLIFLAGLQAVPTELYDAASIDGAGWFDRMRTITVPMITPVLFYNLTIATITIMQYFLVPFVINQGSGFPNGMTNFPMIYFYRQAFSYFNMGYGAVIAWIIFALGMFFAAILFASSKKWVYYAGGKE
ncbi:carbohydrate ABC transporter permease [Spirochaeta dissipatitropha]